MLNKKMAYTSPMNTNHLEAHVVVGGLQYSANVQDGKEVEQITYTVGIYVDKASYLGGAKAFENQGYHFIPKGSLGHEKQVEDHLLLQAKYKDAIVYS